MNSGVQDVFRAVWGSSGQDVFIAGESGLVLHYSGRSWQKQSVPMTEPLRGIWGAGPTDVFAIGEDGLFLHYNGQDWKSLRVGLQTH
jgi:photosystem II stability/assembly factor-like uncharacterized protein